MKHIGVLNLYDKFFKLYRRPRPWLVRFIYKYFMFDAKEFAAANYFREKRLLSRISAADYYYVIEGARLNGTN